MKYLTAPLTDEVIENLVSGDEVIISGTLYTARDAAHLRLLDSLNKGEELPFNLDGQIIYYSGASPTKPGKVIGASGPTTSYRMDLMTPVLLKHGLKGMIGKGDRSEEVIKAMIEYKAVYFVAIGGAGALIANSVKKNELIAYEDLGPEAIRRLTVEGFRAIVVIDSKGNNLYKTEYLKYIK